MSSDTSIDVVLPYVRNDDEEWVEQFNKYNSIENKGKINTESNGKMRYSSDGMFFKYVIRSISQFIPSVRKLHLLVASENQVPKWINKDTVNVVLHKDFIPQEYLPTFNSCTIEMFLKNIPDLSENFIYTNDDILMLNQMRYTDFFSDSRIVSDYHTSNFDDIKSHVWGGNFINSSKLFFDNANPLVPAHRALPMKLSCVKDCYNKYEEQILNSITRFRDYKNLNQYIYTLYMLKEDRLIKVPLRYTLANSETLIGRIIYVIRNSSSKMLIWNTTIENHKSIGQDLIMALLSKYRKSKYEV